MTEGHFEIRTMSRANLDVAIEWAASEGWNPGRGDGDCFFAADPTGFLMGFLDDEPIASISVVAYDDRYGFLGFYIVPERWRGRGYGIRLWQAGMAYLGKRQVGLDGVPAQQANYKRSGFHLAYRNIRYEGQADVRPPPADSGVVDTATLPFDALRRYDAAFVSAPRDAFLNCWLDPRRRTGRALIVDGEIAGYGVIRPCRRGHKIGPLFADTAAGAETLFRALASTVGKDTIVLDPPEPNSAGIALAESYGLQPSFETARMYTGAPPDLPTQRIFGVTTFELG